MGISETQANMTLLRNYYTCPQRNRNTTDLFLKQVCVCVCVCLCTHVPFCCLSEQKHGLIQRWYFSSHLWKRVSKKKTRYKVLETLSSMDGLGGQILLLFPPSVETSEKEKPLLPKSGYSFSYISMFFSAKWTGYKKKELSLPLCFHLHVDVYLYHINQRRFR